MTNVYRWAKQNDKRSRSVQHNINKMHWLRSFRSARPHAGASKLKTYKTHFTCTKSSPHCNNTKIGLQHYDSMPNDKMQNRLVAK